MKIIYKDITKKNIALLGKPTLHFFGYYHKSPWNLSQNKILFLRPSFINRHPNKDDILKIGFYDLNLKKEHIFSETKSWNWQQGCMLQWHPTKEDTVIFNKREGNDFICVFYNIKSKKEQIHPVPVCDISPDGKKIASLNFPKLNEVRQGYGYEGHVSKSIKISPENDGIFIYDTSTKKKSLVITFKGLLKEKPLKSMSYGRHWVNHIEFSPKSDKLLFFHRWDVPGGMHYSRVYILNLKTNKLSMLLDSGFFSHYCWKNNEEVLIWTSLPSAIGNIRKNKTLSKLAFKLVKPIYKKIVPETIRKKIFNESYCLFSSEGKLINKIPIWNSDGHPSFSPDKRFILTDTYPDKKHYRTLILYDTKYNKRHIVARFYSLPDKKYTKDPNWDYSGMRCDLHPRWNRDGSKVCIDSVHEGFRGMYIIDVSKTTKA